MDALYRGYLSRFDCKLSNQCWRARTFFSFVVSTASITRTNYWTDISASCDECVTVGVLSSPCIRARYRDARNWISSVSAKHFDKEPRIEILSKIDLRTAGGIYTSRGTVRIFFLSRPGKFHYRGAAGHRIFRAAYYEHYGSKYRGIRVVPVNRGCAIISCCGYTRVSRVLYCEST